MKTTLNLVDHVLSLGRRFQEVGRHRDALRLLTRLSGFRELPAEAAEETQARLAELHLKRRRYQRARRHLIAALRHQPTNARYHYLLATALQAEDGGDLQRAAEHYRRALELDPNHVKCLADYGLLRIRLSQGEEGVADLRRAVDKAPEDAEVLGKLIKGLRLTGRTEEARAALHAALFRNARSPRFHKLWNEFRFQQVRQQREKERLRQGRTSAGCDEPVLLPFLRVGDKPPHPTLSPSGGEGRVRGPAGTAAVLAPHPACLPRRPDQRNVQ